MEKISKKSIKGPIILVIGCQHGDEFIGKRVVEELRRIDIKKGKLIRLIGNPKAAYFKKRFIDQDLNRSFPGSKNGNYEERIAYSILKVARKADFVIDIHSTTTDTESLAIITRRNKKILDFLSIFKPKNIVLMKRSIGKKALTYYCKAGVSFEYGKDKDKSVFDNIMDDIHIILHSFGMIGKTPKLKKKKYATDFYKITNIIKKLAGFIVDKKIKNFKLVRKGNIIARNGKEIIKAKNNFYPILFGEKAYKDILGFAAEKVDKY